METSTVTEVVITETKTEETATTEMEEAMAETET